MQARYLTLLIIILLGILPMKSQNYMGRILALDSALSQKDTYIKAKQHKIATMREQQEQAIYDEQRYNSLITLYHEYQSFQYDSALTYARRASTVARRLQNRDLILESDCAQAFCMLSAGLYKEADDVISLIDTTDVTEPYIIIYHRLLARYYFAMADYVQDEPYTIDYLTLGDKSCQRLLHLLKPQSWEWWYINAQHYMKTRDYDQSIAAFKHMLGMPGVDVHTKAIAYSCMGFIYHTMGQTDQAIEALAQSAIYDLETGTTETTAIRQVAEILYQQGDLERATAYIHQSMDDANFYNARQRKIEVGSVLPIIEQSRYKMMQSQRRMLVAIIILISILLIATVTACVVILRQSRKLREAKEIIAGRNRQLSATNQELNEANKIKNEYIGAAFYSSAAQIKKIERLYQSIDRKIVARQYDSIRASLKESTLNQERRDMFRQFDATFLKLFPHFVEGYNSLFPPEERKVPEKDSLTTEMRIFALIRLGITQSERIALFLDYSVNTINTYKTRVKNKSIVENDKFESEIMNLSFEGGND